MGEVLCSPRFASTKNHPIDERMVAAVSAGDRMPFIAAIVAGLQAVTHDMMPDGH